MIFLQEFEPIINRGELLIVGEGDVAVCTLWTPRSRWRDLLDRNNILEVYGPRLAVVGNLYDPKGVINIIRNLYANPHIHEFIVLGNDLSGNLIEALKNAWIHKIPVEVKGQEEPTYCDLSWLKFFDYSDLSGTNDFSITSNTEPPPKTILEPPDFECASLETPVPGALFYGDTLREAWDRLRYYIQNFGTRYESRYGNTLEILGLSTVVTNVSYDEGFPFTEKEGAAYIDFLMDPNEKPEVSYDYGPLIAGIMDLPRELLSTRHAFWPVYRPDHRNIAEPPCLVSCWFKERKGELHGIYIFRSQDMYAGYSRNVYGLYHFQKKLAEKHGLGCGPMVTHTHSAHLYERDVDDDLKSPIIMDPAGDCIISVEKDHIQVDIVRGEETIQRLNGKFSRALESELRHYVSDVSHAMYLGRELYKAEMRLHGKFS